MRSPERSDAGPHLEIVHHFELRQVHDNDSRCLAFIGHVQSAAPDRDTFKGRVRVRSAEVFLHGRPIDNQAFDRVRRRVPAEYPPVRFFAEIDPPAFVLGDSFDVVAGHFSRGQGRQLLRRETIRHGHQICGAGVGSELNPINRGPAVAHGQQFAA